MGISGILSFPVFGMGSTPVRKTMVIWASPKQQFDIQNTISNILIPCAFMNGFRNKVFETFPWPPLLLGPMKSWVVIVRPRDVGALWVCHLRQGSSRPSHICKRLLKQYRGQSKREWTATIHSHLIFFLHISNYQIWNKKTNKICVAVMKIMMKHLLLKMYRF